MKNIQLSMYAFNYSYVNEHAYVTYDKLIDICSAKHSGKRVDHKRLFRRNIYVFYRNNVGSRSKKYNGQLQVILINMPAN